MRWRDPLLFSYYFFLPGNYRHLQENRSIYTPIDRTLQPFYPQLAGTTGLVQKTATHSSSDGRGFNSCEFLVSLAQIDHSVTPGPLKLEQQFTRDRAAILLLVR